MNKKANTLLFILGATVFNIIITLGSVTLLLITYSRLIMPHLPESAHTIGAFLSIIGGALLAFFIYRFAFGVFLKKVNVDKYFDPLFKSRYIKK
jgi:hypothetical protein